MEGAVLSGKLCAEAVATSPLAAGQTAQAKPVAV
jgi:hypothetical protein